MPMTQMSIMHHCKWDYRHCIIPDEKILLIREIWINYFLRMMVLYSKKVYELSKESENDELDGSLSYLNAKEKEFLAFLLKKRLYEFTPIEVSKMLGVTNKTIINRCAKLVNNGLLIPIIVKTRIRSYRLSDFSKTNEKKILKKIS
mgnify:CR=1 FL=1